MALVTARRTEGPTERVAAVPGAHAPRIAAQPRRDLLADAIAHPWFGWLLLGLAGLEWRLWTTFATTAVVPHYPPGHDQAVYLAQAYAAYEHLQTLGPWQGTLASVDAASPNGVLLPLLAACWFLVAGPDRLGALSLNFVGFLMLQAAAAWAVHHVTHNRGWALSAVGLLLCAHTPYLDFGGLFDFRTDFLAACLFGVVCALTVTSNYFASRRLTVAIALLVAATILLRFITAAYFVGIVAITGGVLLVQVCRRRSLARQRLSNLLLAGGLVVLLTGVGALRNVPAIYQYYAIDWSANATRGLIAAPTTPTIVQSPLYYLRVLPDQFPAPFAASVLLLLLAALARPWHTAAGLRSMFRFSPLAIAVVGGSVAVPLALLSLHHTKAVLLLGVVFGPAVLATVLVAWHVSNAGVASARAAPAARYVFAAVFLTGMASSVGSLTRRPFPTLSANDLAAVDAGLPAMVRKLATADIAADAVISNTPADYALRSVLQITAFEMSGRLLRRDRPADLLDHGFISNIQQLAGPESDAVQALGAADALLLAESPRPASGADFAFFPGLIANNPALLRYADEHFVQAAAIPMSNGQLRLYLRPRVQVAGVSADGWITASGVELRLPGWLMDRPMEVALSGAPIPSVLPRPVGVSASMSDADGRALPGVSARWSETGDRYTVRLDVPSLAVASDAEVLVHLAFSSRFVPSQLGTSPDPRELVVPTPDTVQVTRQPGSASR